MAGAGDYLQPKAVITAPDGRQLWIDPLATAGTATGSGSSLWPPGFGVTVKFGPMPTTDPLATSSSAAFLRSQAWTLAKSPGPAGVPWILWGLALLALALAPYLPILARPRK